MHWFEGNITHAVQLSKTRNAIFVVYVEGSDDNSKSMTEMIDAKEVSNKLESKSFVAVKVAAGTEAYTQFVQIYQLVPVPSLFFIGHNGMPLEVIPQKLEQPEILSRIDNIVQKAGIQPFALFGAPSTSEKKDLKKESASLINSEGSSPQAEVIVQATSSTESPTGAAAKLIDNAVKISETERAEVPKETLSDDGIDTESKNDTDLSKQEKIERAKQLIEQKREAKKNEEEQVERQKELERRKMGQDVQKMRRQQQDQELKQLMEDRQREKNEQLAARQKVLAQIAQDKAERAKRFGNENVQEQPAPEKEPVPVSRPISRDNNTARLQFRLADGSTHTHDFEGQDTLQFVRNYVHANLNLPYRNFGMSTTFPRRQFTDNDNSQTLADLQLVPNAVILILPMSISTVIPSTSGGITGFFWLILTPFINLYSYIRGLFGGERTGTPSTSTGTKRTLDQSGNSDTSTSSTIPKRRLPESTLVKRQGNVYRLADRNKDSDDENNTWNGNSTQQM